MKGQDVVLSRGWNGWPTPRDLFNVLNETLSFTIDLAADETNALVPRFFSEEQNSLTQDWKDEVGFLNPPYNRCKEFIEKAIQEDQNCKLVSVLVPSRTDTRWFQSLPAGTPVFLFKGRLKFGNREKNSPAPFPSCLIFLGKQRHQVRNVLEDKLVGRGRWTTL